MTSSGRNIYIVQLYIAPVMRNKYVTHGLISDKVALVEQQLADVGGRAMVPAVNEPVRTLLLTRKLLWCQR